MRKAELGELCRSELFVFTDFWDTAGQERFRSITQSYYRSANALILTYDITCEESFRCLPEWLREIEQYASNKVITVLVGKTPWPEGPAGPALSPVQGPFLLHVAQGAQGGVRGATATS